MSEIKPNIWMELRKPFPKEAIGKIPKGGIQLDYIGHAQVTDRLNTVVGAENWNLEPLSFNLDNGTPVITTNITNAVMWCRLTVLGASKICVGTVKKTAFEVEKELIGDALRNGAMRFGIALELWSKDELESQIGHVAVKPQAPYHTDFQPEPSVDIADSESITTDMIIKLGGQLKLKGITERLRIMNVLNNLAKTKGGDTIKDISLLQGNELLESIKASTKEALEMLMESE